MIQNICLTRKNINTQILSPLKCEGNSTTEFINKQIICLRIPRVYQ